MQITFRCMKEKKAVEETPLDIKKLKNKEGRFLVTAVHKSCGTKLAKICGKLDAEKIAKFLGKSVDKLEYHVKAVKKGKGEEDDEYDGAEEEDDERCNYAYAVGSAQKKKSKPKSGGKGHDKGRKHSNGKSGGKGSSGKKRKSGGKGSKGSKGSKGKKGGC